MKEQYIPFSKCVLNSVSCSFQKQKLANSLVRSKVESQCTEVKTGHRITFKSLSAVQFKSSGHKYCVLGKQCPAHLQKKKFRENNDTLAPICVTTSVTWGCQPGRGENSRQGCYSLSQFLHFLYVTAGLVDIISCVKTEWIGSKLLWSYAYKTKCFPFMLQSAVCCNKPPTHPKHW